MKLKSFLVYISLSLLFLFLLPSNSKAQEFPRLANYFLKWEMSPAEARELARWDFLILDLDNQKNNPELLLEIRRLNPNIKIIAYLASEEIVANIESFNNGKMRQALARQLLDSWYLKDLQGRKITNWPGTYMLNITNLAERNSQGQRFNDLIAHYVRDNIYASGLWDGVFFDNLWENIAWLNDGDIDIANDRQLKDSSYLDKLWEEGSYNIIKKTRELCGNDFLILANGRVHWPYQEFLNGMMFEEFPTPWEADGSWQGVMRSYLKTINHNPEPYSAIINAVNTNRADYQFMRYSLASALLGNAYFSLDYAVSDHAQTWWYDEYSVALGEARSEPFNLLSPSKDLVPGLWRRNFKNGLVVLNSTDKVQNFLFSKEEFERIKGAQDPKVNDGLRVNYVRLNPKDAIILLNELSGWEGSSFVNGNFLRVFNSQGQQSRAGFFSYISSIPAGAQVLFLNPSLDEYIYSFKNKVYYFKGADLIWEIEPFAKGFMGPIYLASGDLNNDAQPELIFGAGAGGGPQVLVYSLKGEPIANFFAYDKNFRGGLRVAVGDIDGDGQLEIITAAGPGGGPHIRAFSLDAKEKANFFAYDKDFRGGLSIAVGDIDGDLKDEIITAPGRGLAPVVNIFSSKGEKLSSFLAYDENYTQGLELGFSKSSNLVEISVGISAF